MEFSTRGEQLKILQTDQNEARQLQKELTEEGLHNSELAMHYRHMMAENRRGIDGLRALNTELKGKKRIK